MFDKLFEPITIGGVTIWNRLSTAPMEVLHCDENGMVTDRYLKYVEARAKGGFGLIINEAHAVLKGTGGFNRCSGMWMDEQIEGQAKVAKVAHDNGAKIAIQLIHVGRQSEVSVTNRELEAPTAVADPTLYDVPREMSKEDIDHVVNAFGDAAARVRKAGYDFVEIHGAHGYLLEQFLSPYSNKRTDEYGGNLYNRARFSLEIIENIRQKAGVDFPIIYRMSMTEFMEDGLTIAETRAFAQMLEKAGVACIHASQGNYATIRYMLPPAAVPHAFTADMAEEIKKVVSIPVLNVGRYTDPYVAEAALEAGKADMIAFARQSLADPQFPSKTKAGKVDEIRHCIGCLQGCIGGEEHGIYAQVPVICMVNPELSYEGEYTYDIPKQLKNVAVVGGGLAGLWASYAAARRGHKVTLYEKTGKLGGQWNLAIMPPFKQEGSTMLVWLKKQMENYQVEVKLNTEATAQMLQNGGYDAAIISTGCEPVKPRIPGIDSENVCYIPDVLGCKRNVGKNCVVIGGGEAGTETAAFLLQIQKNVTIIEVEKELCRTGQSAVNSFLFDYIGNRSMDGHAWGGTRPSARILTEAMVTEITDHSVTYVKDDKTYTIEDVTDVIIGVGNRIVNPFKDGIEGIEKVEVVGDAAELKDALAAVQNGFRTGYYI